MNCNGLSWFHGSEVGNECCRDVALKKPFSRSQLILISSILMYFMDSDGFKGFPLVSWDHVEKDCCAVCCQDAATKEVLTRSQLAIILLIILDLIQFLDFHGFQVSEVGNECCRHAALKEQIVFSWLLFQRFSQVQHIFMNFNWFQASKVKTHVASFVVVPKETLFRSQLVAILFHRFL